jgi:transcriptional regulator with XRE-family HTH domain
MAARKSGPLDAMVGAKIRLFRINRAMSQTTLAERVGVSFQQVQKYEKGANRVGASRLSQIASVLGITVGELFESPQEKIVAANSPVHLLAEPGALRVLKAYVRTNSRIRLAIAKLVESIADQKPVDQKSVVQNPIVQKSMTKPSMTKPSMTKPSMTKASVARLDAATRGERGSSRART